MVDLLFSQHNKGNNMRKIRHSAFETNSSSMHSISVDSTTRNMEKFGDTVEVTLGEFGWGYESYNDPLSKLSYVLTYIHTCSNELEDSIYEPWLREAIKDYCGSEIVLTNSDGYIDHQSVSMLAENDIIINDEATFKKNVIDFIFNPKYTLIIDNDNH